MTIAQCKAARRKFQQNYTRAGRLGLPYYKRKSTAKMERRERELRERQKEMAGRGKK